MAAAHWASGASGAHQASPHPSPHPLPLLVGCSSPVQLRLYVRGSLLSYQFISEIFPDPQLGKRKRSSPDFHLQHTLASFPILHTSTLGNSMYSLLCIFIVHFPPCHEDRDLALPPVSQTYPDSQRMLKKSHGKWLRDRCLLSPRHCGKCFAWRMYDSPEP